MVTPQEFFETWKPKIEGLTDRECEVLKLLMCGHSNISVGVILERSPHTIKAHHHTLSRLMRGNGKGMLYQAWMNFITDYMRVSQ